VTQFGQGGGGSATDLIRVGGDLGASILAGVPEQFRAVVEPLIPNIVLGIQQAFSLAIATVFLIGAGTTIAALAVSLFMEQLPLRKTFGSRDAVPTPAEGETVPAEAHPHGTQPVARGAAD
jgi:hypothetical protein